jgi:hypothetical protein
MWHSKHYTNHHDDLIRDWDEVTSNFRGSPCAKPLGEGSASMRRRYRLSRPLDLCATDVMISSCSASSRALDS